MATIHFVTRFMATGYISIKLDWLNIIPTHAKRIVNEEGYIMPMANVHDLVPITLVSDTMFVPIEMDSIDTYAYNTRQLIRR